MATVPGCSGRPTSTFIQRIRIQLILTVFVVAANLIGIGVVILLVTVAFPTPNVFDAPAWVNFVIVPVYIALAVLIGAVWGTRRIFKAVRWALDERPPTKADQRNAFAVPWRLTVIQSVLWAGGVALFTLLYGLYDPMYIPRSSSPSASVARWSAPPTICSPSSRCDPSPHAHSRQAIADAGWLRV